MKKYDNMVNYAKERSELKQKQAMDCLTELLKNGESVSVRKISKITGISATTLYNYEEFMNLINKHRDGKVKQIKQSEESKDVLLKIKNQQISALQKRIKELEADTGYKEKYLEAQEKIKVLEKRIEDMFSDNW